MEEDGGFTRLTEANRWRVHEIDRGKQRGAYHGPMAAFVDASNEEAKLAILECLAMNRDALPATYGPTTSTFPISIHTAQPPPMPLSPIEALAFICSDHSFNHALASVCSIKPRMRLASRYIR